MSTSTDAAARSRPIRGADASSSYVPSTETLPRVVEGHARTTPDAVAIERGDQRLSYAKLNDAANALARDLVDAGVRRGSVVGIHIGRSIEWVVAMLATLKAAGVCMSLDPAAPDERMRSAIALAAPEVILTDSATDSDRYPAGVAALTIDARGLPAGPAEDPATALSPHDLAYAVHTSGSAGRPKIVLAQHSWLTFGAFEGTTLNRTTAADRGSWLGPAGAGIAIHEVCGLLWAGASIHVGEQEVIASPPALGEWLIANRITQAFVITPVGEVLQSLDWPPDTDLRLMTLGGDKLTTWGPPGLPFEVAVSYGSLEAFQIANSLHPWEARCTPSTATAADRAGPPPVGRPLPGVGVHVLEGDLTPTPPELIGELWIDSAGLSLGYLGDAAQTADRFRPNPFGAPGSRLYRSGDAGRFRASGVLEHHGRIDDVVKIRGYRVEVGDVEWVLAHHPKVSQVCVVPTSDAGAPTALVACVVGGADVTPGELRTYAAERLPDYMVPVAFVPLARLPVNTSNKVDRRALPPANWSDWRPVQPYRAPSGEVEPRLATLFSELLDVERVGADDNFIDLGGDSLSAARLQQRIKDAFGVKLGLREVMTAATLGELAGHLQSSGTGNGEEPELPPILPRKRRGAPSERVPAR